MVRAAAATTSAIVGTRAQTAVMDEELPPQVEAIRERIPERWGKWIDVGPGWFPLLAELDAQLARLDPAYVVHQCKSKFGGLRFYADTTLEGAIADEFAALIRAAETASQTRCEECGAPGRLIDVRGWMTTLCAEHEAAARFTRRR